MTRLERWGRRIAGVSGWNFLAVSGATFAVRVFSVVYAVALARFLQPAGFGVYSEVLAYASLVLPVCTLGLDYLATRELAGRKRPGRQLSTFGGLSVGVSLLAVVGLLGLGTLFPDLPMGGFIIMSVGLPIAAAASIIGAAFSAQERFTVPSGATIWGGGTLVGLGLACVLIRAPFAAFFAVYVVSDGVRLLYLARAARREGWRLERPDWGAAGPMLRAAVPYGALALVSVVHLRVDIAMVGRLAGEVEAGNYAAATRFFYVIHGVPALMLSVLFPRFVLLRRDAVEGARALYATASRVLFWIGCLAAVGGGLLARPAVLALYGEAYAGAVGPTTVLMAALVFMFVQAPSGTILAAGDRLRAVILAALAVTSVNVVANFILIPAYGALGAATATLFSEAVSLGVFAWLACRRIGSPLTGYALSTMTPSLSRAEWCDLLNRRSR